MFPSVMRQFFQVHRVIAEGITKLKIMSIICVLMLFWMRWITCRLQGVIERDVKDDIVMREEGGI